ncbi:hypothetical protein AAVH_22792 [Aphelenchoides avenae]|nr:hypothetical protein AAVH_22792 [Aphelenchus avenae]
MLQLEVCHDILLWLRRTQLDAVEIATKFFSVAVKFMPNGSPLRSIRIHVLPADCGQGIVANIVDNDSDGTWASSNGGYRRLYEAHNLALYVCHANITEFSYVAWAETDRLEWTEKFRCLEGRLTSTTVSFNLHRCSPVPAPILHTILRDICNTTKGLELSGSIDVGDGVLLRLPAMRSCTRLRIADYAPVLTSAAEVRNYVEWLHLPTEGIGASSEELLPFATRRLLNLKMTNEACYVFMEGIIESDAAAVWKPGAQIASPRTNL